MTSVVSRMYLLGGVHPPMALPTRGCKGGGNFLIKSNFIWKGNYKNKNKIETKRDSNDEVFVYTTIVNIMTVF
jgi:hypothetical protein